MLTDEDRELADIAAIAASTAVLTWRAAGLGDMDVSPTYVAGFVRDAVVRALNERAAPAAPEWENHGAHIAAAISADLEAASAKRGVFYPALSRAATAISNALRAAYDRGKAERAAPAQEPGGGTGGAE